MEISLGTGCGRRLVSRGDFNERTWHNKMNTGDLLGKATLIALALAGSVVPG